MSVLSPIDPSAATDQTKELLDGLQQRLGRIPNMIRVMAHSPTVLGGYLDFTNAMQRTTLPASLRDQLALVVAEATGSRYFLALAEALGRRDGLGAEEIAAIFPLTRRLHSVRLGSATSSWWKSSRSSA